MLPAHSHAVKVELHRVRRLLRGYRVKRLSGSQYASIGKEFCTIPVRRLSHISVRQVLMHCVFASTSLRQNRRLRWFLDLPSAPLARFSSCHEGAGGETGSATKKGRKKTALMVLKGGR